MNFLLSFMAAHAGEIQVSARSPVVLSIDGNPAGIAGTLIDTTNLDAGPHRVQVRNFIGSLLAESNVQLADNQRLRLIYDRELRVLTELDRTLLTSAQAPTPPASAVQLGDSPTGSVLVTGLSDISGEVYIGGERVAFTSDHHGFLGSGLAPPFVELHIRDNGKLRYHGAVEVSAGGITTCRLRFVQTAWTVDCGLEGPEASAD